MLLFAMSSCEESVHFELRALFWFLNKYYHCPLPLAFCSSFGVQPLLMMMFRRWALARSCDMLKSGGAGTPCGFSTPTSTTDVIGLGNSAGLKAYTSYSQSACLENTQDKLYHFLFISMDERKMAFQTTKR